MDPRGGWALVAAAALLVAAPGRMQGQQLQPQAMAPQATAPQAGAGQPKRLGRPFPGSLGASQQPGAAPPGAQGGGGAAQRLGRGTPAPAQPMQRVEPNVSVSVVSPQNDSTVFGRRQRSGNQGSLRGGTGGGGSGGMGGGGGFNQMGQ